MTLRLVFMGTPDFAVLTLRALLDAGHEVVAVYTQPPRAAGRGMNARKSPVQAAAEAACLPVLHPDSLKSEDQAARFSGFAADAAIVVAYGLLLPKPIFAAPRQRAIMAGDSETGIAVMRMNEGLDTGDICLEQRVPLSGETTGGALHDQLTTLGAGLMADAMHALEAGTLRCKRQAEVGATYADKISASDTRIDWSCPAVAVHAQIRALSPHPGAWFETEINGKRERIKVLGASLAEVSGTPGTLLDDKLTVACGDGAVRLTQVQRAGKRPVPAEEFLRGAKLGVGQELG